MTATVVANSTSALQEFERPYSGHRLWEREATDKAGVSLTSWYGGTVLWSQVFETALIHIETLSHFGRLSYQPATANITKYPESILEWLTLKQVKLPNPGEVRAYLLRYPDLVNHLIVYTTAALERFSAEAQLSLEVYHDPEIEDEYLTLYIRQKHYDEAFMSAIEDIRSKYRKRLAPRSGRLHLTTDFRPVR